MAAWRSVARGALASCRIQVRSRELGAREREFGAVCVASACRARVAGHGCVADAHLAERGDSRGHPPALRPARGARAFGSSRGAPAFEQADDGAEEALRNVAGAGGFLRGNFVKEHSSDDKLTDVYELKGKLGIGAFGSVCAATHRVTGEGAAVKSVPKGNASEMKALRCEIGFLKETDHPHICRLYETFEDESNVYLVMEHCSGGELWKRVLSAHELGLGYGERELARAVQQMLRALAYCHAHGIVHRDVKPQNFLYESAEEGAVLKLVDFGVSGVVAHFHDPEPSPELAASGEEDQQERFLTRTVGTDGYIAPEVLLSRPYGVAADIFSVGATMHAAVVGLPPRWENDGSKPPAYAFPGKMRWRMLPKEAQELLAGLLNPDPEARLTAVDALKSPWFEGLEVGPESRQCQGCLIEEEYVLRMRKFAKRSKLQKCALASVAAFSHIHGQELESLRRAFLAADTDDSGEVSMAEMEAALGKSEAAAKLNIHDVAEGVDLSHQGSITFSEFLAAAASRKLLQCSHSAQHAFDALDADGDGLLSVQDIEHALHGVMTREELLQEIGSIDTDGDGQLNFEEFQILLNK